MRKSIPDGINGDVGLRRCFEGFDCVGVIGLCLVWKEPLLIRGRPAQATLSQQAIDMGTHLLKELRAAELAGMCCNLRRI